MEKHDCEQCEKKGDCAMEHTLVLIRQAIKDNLLEDTTRYVLSKDNEDAIFKWLHLTIGELGDNAKIKAFTSMAQTVAASVGKTELVTNMFRVMVVAFSKTLIKQALESTAMMGQALGVTVLMAGPEGDEGFDEEDIPEHLRGLMAMPVVGGVQ